MHHPTSPFSAGLKVGGKGLVNHTAFVVGLYFYCYLLHKDTDFEFLSDSVLVGLISTSGLPDQRMSKHRVMYCLRSYPTARDAVAWVLCCRGRRVSSAFAAVINAVFGPRPATDRSAWQQVWTLLMQVCSPVIIPRSGVMCRLSTCMCVNAVIR